MKEAEEEGGQSKGRADKRMRKKDKKSCGIQKERSEVKGGVHCCSVAERTRKQEEHLLPP